jgi:hypothetical protein
MRLRRIITLASLAFGAVACGDLYSDPVQTVSTGPSEVGVASPPPDFDASVSIPNDLLSSCPSNALEGAACGTTGLTCEYGSSPDMHCNTTLVCVPDPQLGGTWTARPSMLCPSYACPAHTASIVSVDGTACQIPQTDAGPATDADELLCPMADGTCACTTGVDGAHAHPRRWVCVKPSTGCLTRRPLAGESCPSEQSCDYGSCEFKHGLRMQCDGTAWRTEGAVCN